MYVYLLSFNKPWKTSNHTRLSFWDRGQEEGRISRPCCCVCAVTPSSSHKPTHRRNHNDYSDRWVVCLSNPGSLSTWVGRSLFLERKDNFSLSSRWGGDHFRLTDVNLYGRSYTSVLVILGHTTLYPWKFPKSSLWWVGVDPKLILLFVLFFRLPSGLIL